MNSNAFAYVLKLSTGLVLSAAALSACSDTTGGGASGAGATGATSTSAGAGGGSGTTTSASTGGAGGAAPGAGGAGGGGQLLETTDPSPASVALWSKIQGYSSWETFPELSAPKLSTAHFDLWVLAHYNDVVKTAMANHTLPLPDGSIIVKDNFVHENDATPLVITVMSKHAGKWYWLEATPDGKVVVAESAGQKKPLQGINVALCRSCHQNATANDYVFTHSFM